MTELAVQAYTDIITLALPIAIVFELGNIIVCTLLRVAFGGRLWVGK